MRNWDDVLPPEIVKKQKFYEGRMLALRMRRAGMTLREIGDRLGITSEAVRGRLFKAERHERRAMRGQPSTPIESYFADDSDLLRFPEGMAAERRRKAREHLDYYNRWHAAQERHKAALEEAHRLRLTVARTWAEMLGKASDTPEPGKVYTMSVQEGAGTYTVRCATARAALQHAQHYGPAAMVHRWDVEPGPGRTVTLTNPTLVYVLRSLEAW